MWKSPKSHLRRDLSDLSVSETSRLMTLQTCIQNDDPKHHLTSHGCEAKSSPIKNTSTPDKPLTSKATTIGTTSPVDSHQKLTFPTNSFPKIEVSSFTISS